MVAMVFYRKSILLKIQVKLFLIGFIIIVMVISMEPKYQNINFNKLQSKTNNCGKFHVNLDTPRRFKIWFKCQVWPQKNCIEPPLFVSSAVSMVFNLKEQPYLMSAIKREKNPFNKGVDSSN